MKKEIINFEPYGIELEEIRNHLKDKELIVKREQLSPDDEVRITAIRYHRIVTGRME